MSTQVGKGHGFSLYGTLIDTVSGAYYNTRTNLQSIRVGTNGELDQIIGQTGEVNSLLFSGDFLEMTCEVIPESATQLGAYQGAKIPPRGTGFNASAFGKTPEGTIVNIPMGPFTNSGVNNTGSGVTDSQPWIFISGEVNAPANGKWSMNWTLHRYPGITSATAISS